MSGSDNSDQGFDDMFDRGLCRPVVRPAPCNCTTGCMRCKPTAGRRHAYYEGGWAPAEDDVSRVAGRRKAVVRRG